MIRDPAARTFALFAAASLAAVLAGAAAMSGAGLGAGSWMRNPAAWAAGALLGGAMLFAGRAPAAARTLPVLAAAALAATFLARDQQGVHRWIDLGPLHVNVAGLLLPCAVVALGLTGIATRFGMAMTVLIAALLFLQPDGSQATAFAAAVLIFALRSDAAPAPRIAIGALAVAAAAATWLRPDPLQPVPEVEGIFALAWSVSPALALLAACALAAASLAPLAARGDGPRSHDAATGLAAYFTIVALAPLAGAYPVPLVGLGMSFPVGYWVAVGLLSARLRRPRDG